MKKLLLAAAIFLTASTEVYSQYYQLPFINAGYNPGMMNNDPEQPAGSIGSLGWTNILGSGASDAWSAQQSMPFAFDFAGNAVNTFYVSSSGVLTFNSNPGSAPGFTNSALPSANIPDKSICVWGLQLTGSNDAVVTKVFGTAPYRQLWVMWASASSATLTGTAWSYWSIVLEETTNRIYIVDQRTYSSNNTNVELTAGIQVDGATALSVSGSPALGSNTTATGGGTSNPSDNSFYMFGPGVMPDFDASLFSIEMPKYHQAGSAGFDISTTVINMGSQTINSLELKYVSTDGTTETATVSGLNIATGNMATVTHPVSYAPTSVGTVSIDLTATKVNGQTDQNTFDNTVSGDVVVYDQAYPRVVLYETFTSSTCPPCKPGNENFEDIMVNVPDTQFASVKYQMSWPGDGDPYYTDEGGVRRGYYGINSVPRLEIDGGYDGNSNSFVMADHTDALEVPAFVQIDAEYMIWADSQTVKVCATVHALKDLGNNTLYMAITESVTHNNIETNGETEFYDVMKKMLPDADGQSITITTGMDQKVCETYTFKGDYRLPNNAGDPIDHSIEHSVEDFNNLKAVVWVQNDNTLEVLNSVNAELVTEFTSVNELANNGVDFSVYPNPATDHIIVETTLDYSSKAIIRIYDVTGKLVIVVPGTTFVPGTNSVQINTNRLPAGVYQLEIATDRANSVKQLIIQ